MDVILTGGIESGWHIKIFEQTKNKIFKDVTNIRVSNESRIRQFQDVVWNENGENIDPIFFENGFVASTKDPFLVDVDNDGDFDILPIGPQVHSKFGYTDNFYYENIDGVFYERWYNDPEE